MKILITGGHFSPALAVIDNIKNTEIVFVGREYALSKDNNKSLEYKEIAKRKIKFINLNTGKLNRELSLKTIIDLFKIPSGFYNSFKIIKKEKPNVVLSFGSYISVPICIAAWINKIPVYIHEQTIKPGLSNKMLSYISKKTFVSFPDTLKYFDKSKTILTGNPIRKSFYSNVKKQFEINKNKSIIFITGGSLGSHSINLIISKIINKLLEKYIVIIQTGNSEEHNDYSLFIKIKNNFKDNLKQNLYIFKNLNEQEISYIYSISDLIISRSGANTFFELLMLKKPCITIPLPWSAQNEQQEHAMLIKTSGAGEIFNQNEDPIKLINLIKNIFRDVDQYKDNYKNISYLIKKNAAEEIIKNTLSD